ncbi:MAG: F0F1 ATP synthase subunit delta [Betaproteobacteria bacterium HGW-Betaproteobacteria-11]|nr:MAG: F0F1 ATP synthase subunit delta [Betaproteobacteria bacterium HGW-Betaproteobacteria-11]
MAENVTLARPYAEAAFRLARDAGPEAMAAWSAVLVRLAAVVSRPEVEECINNPRLSYEQLAQFLEGLSDQPLTLEQKNFVRVLVDNDRLVVLPEISAVYDSLKHAQEGIKDAEITSAFAMDEFALKNLLTGLEQKFGCQIQANVTIDPELIGGVRIAVGDEVIDASVRGKLSAMATALQN